MNAVGTQIAFEVSADRIEKIKNQIIVVEDKLKIKQTVNEHLKDYRYLPELLFLLFEDSMNGGT